MLARIFISSSIVIAGFSSATAEEFRWPVGWESKGGGDTQGLDEFRTASDPSFPERIVNLAAKEQARLVVEWGKATMGYLKADSSSESEDDNRYTLIWRDDDSLRIDRSLGIRGRLLMESPDGRIRRPIDWLQGVRVVVARLPDRKYDWSQRQEMHESAFCNCIIWKDGEFLANWSPSSIVRPVGRDAKFQVALSLGERKGNEITWRNTTGVLPQSVTMLSIPGAPVISETMQAINGAPSYSQRDFNPAKLVRAVNHLIPLGKDKAIEHLREFLEIALHDQTKRVDGNIDTSDQTSVTLIVRLLFENSDPKEGLALGGLPEPQDADKPLWPLYPIHLQDDLPFFLVDSEGGKSGVQAGPGTYVDWAEAHGKIRTKLLRPLDNPMTAAERLVSLPQTRRLYGQWESATIRKLFIDQAWNAFKEADPDVPKPKPFLPWNTVEAIDRDLRVKLARSSKIHWNAETNRYVVD